MQVHPLMATALFDSSGLFQQDNIPCHAAKTAQEELAQSPGLQTPQISIQLNIHYILQNQSV